MNLSLRNRVAISFIIANVVVLVLGFTIFHFLNTLNKKIEVITSESNRIIFLTDEIRISVVSILKFQRKILSMRSTPQVVNKLITLCEGFTNQLQNLDTMYSGVEIKQIIAKMLGYVDSLKLILKKASVFKRDSSSLSSVGELSDKILEAFSEFQDIQYLKNAERDKNIRNIIQATKQNMMYTLIITFMATILLMLVIPGKIALPFRKIQDAIRELQDCNYDVSIYYNQDDEIGELAREMNKTINSLKKYDELRADRILIETRKFDVLANMVQMYILVANAKNELIYMNNKLYSLLQLQSEDVVLKDMNDTLIPKNIINTYNLAIKRRSKIENTDIKIFKGKDHADYTQGDEGDEDDLIFKGYANVIPIRGKESALDYYLMVLSADVFV